MAVIADQTPFKTTPAAKSLARRLGLLGFFGWWKRELSAAMPAALRAFFERRRARPVLAFDGNTATLWRPTEASGGVAMAESARIALDGESPVVASAGRAALAPLAATGRTPQVIVSLSPRASLRKTLTLPTAIEDHLRQALAYDLDRHTPFKPDELYFDAIVADRDPARNTLRVELAAARRSIVDEVVRQAESFGARVVAVTVDPPRTAYASPIDLLPEDRRLPSLRHARWQLLLPALLLAAGVVAALALPVWQKREEAIALTHASDEALQRAQVSDALRSQLERRVNDYNFALERKYAFPSALQALDDVTRILPDDTWLTQLELHTTRSGKDVQRELTLRGESANAGRLVSLLEDSKLFTQSAPRSPTTKIQPGPGEIFDVSTHVKPLPQPTALPLDKPPPKAAPVLPRPPASPAKVPPASTNPATPNATQAAPAAPAEAAQAAPNAPAATPNAAVPAPNAAGATPNAPATVPPKSQPAAATPAPAPGVVPKRGPGAPAPATPGAAPATPPPAIPGAAPATPAPATPGAAVATPASGEVGE
jgi:general secretion pathway protein L